MRSRSFFHPVLWYLVAKHTRSWGKDLAQLPHWDRVLSGAVVGEMLRGTPEGRSPSWWGVCLLVFWMEDFSCAPLGQLADQTPSTQPLVLCLPRSSAPWSPAGAALSMEESKVTPLPVGLLGGCTFCWYRVAGWPGGGQRRGGAIWGVHSANVDGIWACWARAHRQHASCAQACLSRTDLIWVDLLTPGRPC